VRSELRAGSPHRLRPWVRLGALAVGGIGGYWRCRPVGRQFVVQAARLRSLACSLVGVSWRVLIGALALSLPLWG